MPSGSLQIIRPNTASIANSPQTVNFMLGGIDHDALLLLWLSANGTPTGGNVTVNEIDDLGNVVRQIFTRPIALTANAMIAVVIGGDKGAAALATNLAGLAACAGSRFPDRGIQIIMDAFGVGITSNITIMGRILGQ